MSGTRLRTRATARAEEQLELSVRRRIFEWYKDMSYYGKLRAVCLRGYILRFLDGVDGYPIQRFFWSSWLHREPV